MSSKSGGLAKNGNTATMNFKPGSWEEFLYEIYVGIIVGPKHAYFFFQRFIYRNIIKPITSLFVGGGSSILDGTSNDDHGTNKESKQLSSSSTASLSSSNNNGNDEDDNQKEKPQLKVVGVGFGRTGTYSLMLALEELGYPTLHTQHIYEVDDIFDMWSNKIFTPSFDNGAATLGEPDFDIIASAGFTGTTDFPVALYYEQIHKQYPDCKFILTVRENSEVWFKSWDTMTRSIKKTTEYTSFAIDIGYRMGRYMRWLFAIINKDDTFLTVPFPLPTQDKQKSIQSYEYHNNHVREVIPSHLLLEYNVREGWEPLCNFLNISIGDNSTGSVGDCPTNIPFPKTNSATSIQVQAISALVIPIGLAMFVIFTIVAVVFQKITGKTILQWLNDQILYIQDYIVNHVNNSQHRQQHAVSSHHHQQQKSKKNKKSQMKKIATAPTASNTKQKKI